MTAAFCRECGDLVSAEAHACPPCWRVSIPGWKATVSVRAATAVLAAATAVEEVDEDREALDAPVRVLVRAVDDPDAPAAAFDVRAEATVDYSAKPAEEVLQ